jgi:hypothetical protein
MHTKQFILLTSVSFCITACDKIPEPGQASIAIPVVTQTQSTADAEIILKQFIDASINRHHNEYYDLLSEKDHAIKTREKYLEEQQQLQPNLADKYFHDITYQITAITFSGNDASAEVIYHFPDAERMIKQVYNLAILDKPGLPTLDEMKLQMDMAYKGKPMPMKTVTRHFNLVMENNNWRIHVGWNKP